MTQQRPSSPRWPVLLALIAVVSVVHLAFLLGPVTGMPAADASTATESAAASQATVRSDAPTAAPAVSHPALARVSTVRWIVPAPNESAEVRVPEPTPLATRPARASTPKQQAPPPPPAPAVEVPSNEPATAIDDEALGDAGPVPTEDLTVAVPTAHEPAPGPEEASINEPAPAPDDELLAAVAEKKRAPAASAARPRPLPPAQPPASTRLDYAVTGRIKGIGYNAEGQLDWTLADGRYSARMEMKVFLLGSRVQTSTGRVGPAGLSPERFADRSRSEKAAHFDAEQNRIRFSNNAPDAVLQPGAQDRLSLFLQIAGLLQARPQAYASGQTIEMQVAGTGDADIWRFEVGDEVTLPLPAGEVRARLLKRLPRKEFDSTVEIWLAPGLQHLPVRLRVTQANGDMADQQLRQMP